MEIFNENKQSILDNPGIQRFLQTRKIKPEDFHLIENLANLAKDNTVKEMIIGEFHNFFNLAKDNSAKELERGLAAETDGVKINLYNAFLEVVDKYDWMAADHLRAVLENL